MHIPEQLPHHAPREQRNLALPRPVPWPERPSRAPELRLQPPQRPREPQQARCPNQPPQRRSREPAHRRQHGRQYPRPCDHIAQREAPQPPLPPLRWRRRIELCPSLFHDVPVRNPTRADRLAGAALQAQLPVSLHRLRDRDALLRHRPRQVDAPPRRLHLQARDRVRRARVHAQPAVDALRQVGGVRGVLRERPAGHVRSRQRTGLRSAARPGRTPP